MRCSLAFRLLADDILCSDLDEMNYRFWPVPACEAGATKVPFADRFNIVYRPLSANIGNRGSRPGAVLRRGFQ